MAVEVKPIRSQADYESALREVERLWGAKAGTRKGDRLDVLATLIDAYEAEHYPMDRLIRSRRSSSAWGSRGLRAATWRTSSARAPALPKFSIASAGCPST
jgi:HTH-type transcriptional regulator / antitoxin HigA